MSARPGRVSSWLRTFAESPTSTAPGRRARPPERPERDPDELERAGRRARAEVRAEAALGPAPEVVGEPDRRDGRDAPGPRAPTTAPTSGSRSPRKLRPCGASVASRRSRSCRAAVDEARGRRGRSRGARGRARPRSPEARPQRRRSSSASRRRSPRRPGRRPRARPGRARADPRAARGRPARRAADEQRATTPFASPSPPPSRRAKARDREVGVCLGRAARGRRGGRRRRGAAGPARHVSLGERQRLALPAAREPHDARARRLGLAPPSRRASRRRRRRPPRPGTQPGARHGLADPRLLVARGDEDGQPLAHSPAACVGGGAGSTPSAASWPSP